MSFGNNLVNLRKQKGWSQDELADNLNLSRQAVSKWENDMSKPDIDNVKKISQLFSVGIDDLLNNDISNDKAFSIDIKKKDKRDRWIALVKVMVLALVIIYALSVIYKLVSLLIIVNGVKQYETLSNYHYIISTYDEDSLIQKEECWFKDGKMNLIRIEYQNTGEYKNNSELYVDFNNEEIYEYNNLKKEKNNIDYNKFISIYGHYKKGGALYSRLPLILRKTNILYLLGECSDIFSSEINYYDNIVQIELKNENIVLDKNTLLPKAIYNAKNLKNISYFIEIDK